MSLQQKFAVGARIGTCRNRDRMCFPATIVGTHDGFPDCYTILYDCGEEKTLDLSNVKFKVLNDSIRSNTPPVARDGRPKEVRIPFFGNEDAAKAHLRLDETPFLRQIKKSLGIDHQFMVIVCDESAHGRDERCRYTKVCNGKRTESSVHWQNVDEVMADKDALEALNFGEELVVPNGQSFIALSRNKDELVPVVVGVHMDNMSNCLVDDSAIAGKWHKRKLVVKNAGKWIHVDDANAEDTPNVAIVSGAFDGFDYFFPTLHLRVEAPSGMTFIGQFADILHAVGGGTGIRVTTVYCQHEIVARKKRKHKSGYHKLVGAKRSRSDIALSATSAPR